jgi:hypothetical protein
MAGIKGLSSQRSVYNPRTQNFPAEYFSGADCSIFFNDQLIDEINALEFQLVEQVLPVYGYASYTPSRIIPGTRIVKGRFAINMRSADYMHELLYSQIVSDISNDNVPLINPIGNQPDPALDPAGFASWVQQQQHTLWNALESSIAANVPPDLSQTPYFVNNGFTILIAYGDIDATDMSRNEGRVRTIDEVHVFSAGQRIGLEPDNIKEVFDFVAVDMNSNNRNPF